MIASSWLTARGKRALDVAVATGAMIVLSPVLVGVAILVRLRLGRPVLFRQRRAGQCGEPIDVVKFRSMRNAVSIDGSPLPDEDRLTPFGRRLRSTSLDELPQLWAVLCGEMSIVGPRPLPLTYVERYSSRQRHRLDARPGLTGLAQTRGRNSIDWPTKLACDVEYVERASLGLDLRIMFDTVKAIVTRSGISADDHATMPEFRGESGGRSTSTESSG